MVSSLPLAVITALANGRNKLARPLRRGARIVRARPAKGVKHAARGTGAGQLSGSRHPARHCGSRWGISSRTVPAPPLPPALRWPPKSVVPGPCSRAPRLVLRRYVLRGPCARPRRLSGGSCCRAGEVLLRGTEVPGGAELPGGARCVPPYACPCVRRVLHVSRPPHVPRVLRFLYVLRFLHVLPCALPCSGPERCRCARGVSGPRPWPSSRARPRAVPVRPAAWAARPHRSARPSRRARRGRPSGRI